MLLERAEHPGWLSNAYVVADGPGGHGVLIDSNGVTEPLAERIDRDAIGITHVLCTHEHGDHVVEIDAVARRFGADLVTAADLSDGDVVASGALEIRALATPGHARPHFAFLVDGSDCFTGDALFRRTVGGTRGGGPTGFADLKSSIMERLLALPPATRIHPGHREPTSVAEEWEENPFVRIWRGVDPEHDEPCRVGGEEATLVLWASDYDGGHKAWVRYPGGEDAIVGGSQVERL